MKRVKYKTWNRDSQNWNEAEGVFQQWAQTGEGSMEVGLEVYPVAIVVRADGQTDIPAAEHVTFLRCEKCGAIECVCKPTAEQWMKEYGGLE